MTALKKICLVLRIPILSSGCPNQTETMFKFVLTFSEEPSHKFYITTTSNSKSAYHQCGELTGENSNFIDHLPQEELIQNYQNQEAHILPGWFETCSLSGLKVATMYCDEVIPGKEFVMNTSMIVLFIVPSRHLHSPGRWVRQVNLSNATYFNKKLSLVIHDKPWQLKRKAHTKILSDI
jgi:hypothetical protein